MPCLVSPLSTTTSTGVSWVCRRFWPLRGCPLAARVFHAPSGKVPTPLYASGSLLCFFFVFLFFWAYLFCFPHVHPCNRGVWVLMTQYSLQFTQYTIHNTLFGCQALWHPCLEAKGPHLRKHCPRVISFLALFLGCQVQLCFILYFIF
jgi:hypothetical protein